MKTTEDGQYSQYYTKLEFRKPNDCLKTCSLINSLIINADRRNQQYKPR